MSTMRGGGAAWPEDLRLEVWQNVRREKGLSSRVSMVPTRFGDRPTVYDRYKTGETGAGGRWGWHDLVVGDK